MGSHGFPPFWQFPKRQTFEAAPTARRSQRRRCKRIDWPWTPRPGTRWFLILGTGGIGWGLDDYGFMEMVLAYVYMASGPFPALFFTMVSTRGDLHLSVVWVRHCCGVVHFKALGGHISNTAGAAWRLCTWSRSLVAEQVVGGAEALKREIQRERERGRERERKKPQSAEAMWWQRIGRRLFSSEPLCFSGGCGSLCPALAWRVGGGDSWGWWGSLADLQYPLGVPPPSSLDAIPGKPLAVDVGPYAATTAVTTQPSSAKLGQACRCLNLSKRIGWWYFVSFLHEDCDG